MQNTCSSAMCGISKASGQQQAIRGKCLGSLKLYADVRPHGSVPDPTAGSRINCMPSYDWDTEGFNMIPGSRQGVDSH